MVAQNPSFEGSISVQVGFSHNSRPNSGRTVLVVLKKFGCLFGPSTRLQASRREFHNHPKSAVSFDMIVGIRIPW